MTRGSRPRASGGDSEEASLSYTIRNLREVEDLAAKHGFGEVQEARFPRGDLEAEMVAPWGDRTPPLAVDVGVGRTWLDAK